MSFKIIRNDITKMNVDAVVNTANSEPLVGDGCDRAIYMAAGFEQLMEDRKRIGAVSEGESFLTKGYNLPAKYIIHTVSPLYIDGNQGEEELLRNCYKNSLKLALENKFEKVAFPLISTGSFGYPKEEGMRIAIDEISTFLLHQNMTVYLVVFDEKSTKLGESLFPDLETYIDTHYVEALESVEYSAAQPCMAPANFSAKQRNERNDKAEKSPRFLGRLFGSKQQKEALPCAKPNALEGAASARFEPAAARAEMAEEECLDFSEAINERMKHLADTFQQYLFYLIESKGFKNEDVWKKSIVDRKLFSKIKNDADYHPKKITAMCLCVGLELNLDETRDLLARAGYALSPCDKTDIIFSYFIENKVYDMIEIDIELENHGLPCLIS